MQRTFLSIVLLFGLIVFDSCCHSNTYMFEYTRVDFIYDKPEIEQNESFIFQLVPVDSTLYMAKNNKIQVDFAQSLYALDCEDEYLPVNDFISFKVYCNRDFSDEYPAGSNISELIEVEFYNWKTEELEIVSLEEYIESQITNGSGSAGAAIHNAEYFLQARPSANQTQSFKIEFELTNNEVLVSLSDEIIWK